MFIAFTVSLFWLMVIWVLVEDLRHLHIPLLASPGLFVTGIAYTFHKVGWEAVAYGLIGSVLVGVALLGIGLAFRRFRGVEGLGEADPAFAAALAIWISPDLVPWALVLACLVTLAFIPVLKRFGPHADGRLPFAPGLGLGFGVILMLRLAYP